MKTKTILETKKKKKMTATTVNSTPSEIQRQKFDFATLGDTSMYM